MSAKRKLTLAQAWKRVAEQVDELTGYASGFLCCEIDGLEDQGLISEDTYDEMRARIAEDMGIVVQTLGFKSAYAEDGTTTDERFANHAENRAARVLAALMFAQEVSQ